MKLRLEGYDPGCDPGGMSVSEIEIIPAGSGTVIVKTDEQIAHVAGPREAALWALSTLPDQDIPWYASCGHITVSSEAGIRADQLADLISIN